MLHKTLSISILKLLPQSTHLRGSLLNLFCCTNMSKTSSVNNQITFSKYYLKITILIQNLISIFQTFARKISKNFYINLLDHRGSNPECKDQNLACYHYTIIQFIKNPVLFFYNVHLSANPCSTCGGPLCPDFQIPMEIINPSYIVPLYLYKLSLHNILIMRVPLTY